jgi:enoyl-CoA hydratase
VSVPEILVARDGVIATVVLSNPAKLNALTVAMWPALAGAMDALSADETVRCIVLRGAGREAFSAGADIAEFATERDNADQGRRYHREYVHGALKAVGECRHPTVAMIHGPCVGGGLEIACACDVRISGLSGRFGVPINRLGFAIAYDELAAVLPLTGRAVALEILLEGRVWDAQRALEKGLLSRVVEDDHLEDESAPAPGASRTAPRSSIAGTSGSSGGWRRIPRRSPRGRSRRISRISRPRITASAWRRSRRSRSRGSRADSNRDD